MGKQIKPPKKERNKLFKFLEENKIDEYVHYIKRVEDNSQRGAFDVLLKIKKDKCKAWWLGTFLVGLYFVMTICEEWETILQINNVNDWIGYFLIFGLIGILICSHFLFKFIIEVFIYKNKWVKTSEDKTKKSFYVSNLEPTKF